MTDPLPPRPRIYEQILIIGGGSPTTEGLPIGKVGGDWIVPDYGLAYLLAARHVIETGHEEMRLNEVALPAFYLQRHALEVALKHLMATARDVKAGGTYLASLRSAPHARPPQAEAVPRKHDLLELIELLRQDLSAINYGEVPAELEAAVNRIQGIELGDETRSRYGTGKDSRPSFPKPTIIPVGELQRDLEAAFEKHLYLDANANFDTKNLATDLALEQQATDQEIYRLADDSAQP